MTINVSCPHCGSQLELERPNGPVEATCPACANTLAIDPALVTPPNQPPPQTKKSKDKLSGWVIAGYVFAVLGGWLGIAIAISILMGDKKDKKHGIAILVISVVSQAIWRSMIK